VDNLYHAVHLHIWRQVDIQPAVPRRRVQQREFVARDGRKPPQVRLHLFGVGQQHFVQVAHLHALRPQFVGDVRLEAEPRAVIDPYRGVLGQKRGQLCWGIADGGVVPADRRVVLQVEHRDVGVAPIFLLRAGQGQARKPLPRLQPPLDMPFWLAALPRDLLNSLSTQTLRDILENLVCHSSAS
jgi:hypothetical protein